MQESNVIYSPAGGSITLFSKDFTPWIMFSTYLQPNDHPISLSDVEKSSAANVFGSHWQSHNKTVLSITESTVVWRWSAHSSSSRVAFSVSNPPKRLLNYCAASLWEANLASFSVNSSQREVPLPTVHQVPLCQLNAYPTISQLTEL